MRAAALIVCAIGLAIIVGSTDLLVGNDTPEHLFAAFVNNHLHERAFGFARFYEAHLPLTGHGYVDIVRVLEPVLGWRGAHRAALVLLVELWAFAFVVLVLSLSPRRWPVALLGFPLALQWLLYVGDYPLHAGAALALLAFAAGARPALRPASVLALALVVLGAALCDPLPALVAVVGLVALAAAHTERKRALGRVVLACVPALVVVVVVLGRSAPWHDASGAASGVVERATGLVHHVVTGSTWRGLVHALLVALALAFGVKQAASRPMAAIGALLLLASLALPSLLDGERGARAAALSLSLASALLLALLPWESASVVARRALAAGLAAWLVASAASAVMLHRAMERAAAPALGLLEGSAMTARFAPTALRQPLLLARIDEVGVPGWSPLLHVGELYAIAGVGVPPAYPGAPAPASAHLAAKEPLPEGLDPRLMPGLAAKDDDDGSVHARKLVQLASSSRAIGRVFLFGREGDIEALVRRGWRIEARRDRSALMSFQGCDVTVDVRAPGPHTVSIAPRVQAGSVEPEVTVSAEGPAEVGVRGLSCGAAVVTSTPPCAGVPEVAIVNGGRVFCAPVSQGKR